MRATRAAYVLTSVFLTLIAGAISCSSGSETNKNSSTSAASGSGAGGEGSGSSSGVGGDAPDASGPDPSDAIYDPDHVLEIVIDMAPADWDGLRHQGRNVSDLLGDGCLDGPQESPYTYFPATVKVDGEELPMSAVRKKGLIGSASISKPSLKLSFDEYVPDRELSGVEGLTLNNSRQDPSFVKTCLAFKVFRDAGLPASRCNYAHVTVNGADLGIYANVEPATKRFLARHFADKTGNLYEGTLSDFRAGFMATYDKKTNESDPDRSDLDALTAALASSDAALDAALDKVLDIAEFRRFWALEALAAMWDGYASNLNNHLVYHDPSTGKMAFIPWGPDMSFDANDPFRSPDRPQSVSAKGAVAERLYNVPAQRQAYVDTMKDILNSSWKEGDLLLEIDRIQKLISPYLGALAPTAAAVTDGVRDFVNGRRAAIMSEIVPTPPVWPYPAPVGVCLSNVGTVSGTFSTTFGTLNQGKPFQTGNGSFTMAIPVNMPTSAVAVGAEAGYEATPDGRRQVNLIGSFPDGKIHVLIFFADPEFFADGKEAPFDWQSAFGARFDVPMQGQAQLFGYFGDGKIHFDKASAQNGAPITGSFTASVLSNPLP